jgi:hypothetical protein
MPKTQNPKAGRIYKETKRAKFAFNGEAIQNAVQIGITDRKAFL